MNPLRLLRSARPGRRVATAAALAAAAAVVPSVPAGAATYPGSHPWDKAWVRVADLAPGHPGARVRLTSFAHGTSATFRADGYGAATPYRRVSPGLYTVSTLTGRGKGWALDTVIEVHRSTGYTVLAMREGRRLATQVLLDHLDAPAPGRARVRMLAGVPGVAAVTARVAHGPVLARRLGFGEATGYAGVREQTWHVRVRPATGPTGAAARDTVRLRGGHGYTLLVLKDASGLRLVKLADGRDAPRRPALSSRPTGGKSGGPAGRS